MDILSKTKSNNYTTLHLSIAFQNYKNYFIK